MRRGNLHRSCGARAERKSTFIRRFMEQVVLPNMTDPNEKKRAVDELPQAAQGRTIMTTEPKFVPKEQVEVELGQKIQGKDSSGGLRGFSDTWSGRAYGKRAAALDKTPWSKQEIPFEEAARIGTQKVIKDHATVGIVVTCDGTFGEIDRDAYVPAEEEAVNQLKTLGKPFVMLLNSLRPYNEETKQQAQALEQKYQCAVVRSTANSLGKRISISY